MQKLSISLLLLVLFTLLLSGVASAEPIPPGFTVQSIAAYDLAGQDKVKFVVTLYGGDSCYPILKSTQTVGNNFIVTYFQDDEVADPDDGITPSRLPCTHESFTSYQQFYVKKSLGLDVWVNGVQAEY